MKFSARHLSLSYPSILSSARSCPLCAMLVDQIQLQLSPASVPDFLARPVTVRLWTEYQPGRCEPGPENLRIADINIFAIQEQGSDGVFGNYRLRVCAEEDSYASRWIIARPVHPKRSAQTLEQIKRWLHRCDGGHERCTVGLSGETVEAGDDAVQLPSRLVDVGVGIPPGIPPRPALIRLCQTGGRRGRYTALSHRWGAKHPLTTITANLEEHQRRIPLEKLPRTFQDAIELTRRLGIRYIWIDSLCIVQDDARDWADESKQMGTIYERSYLTIAATSAPDGDGGLFRGGNGRHDQHGGYLKFPCSPAPNEKITGYMYFANWIPPTDHPITEMEYGPLNQRGWVFQERVLSRRILHFMPAQLYWECLAGITCQSGLPSDCDAISQWHESLDLSVRRLEPASSDAADSLSGPNDELVMPDLRHIDPAHPLLVPYASEVVVTADTCVEGRCCRSGRTLDHLHFHRTWEQALCHYSTRKLSFPSDRLVALHGVVERLQKRTQFRCMLGHWLDSSLCFVKSLAWAVDRLPPTHTDDPPRAPTWACLSRERHVYYPQDCHHLRSPWMHVDWAAFGLPDLGMRLVTPLPSHYLPGNDGITPWTSQEPPLVFTGLLINGAKGDRLLDDVPFVLDKPDGEYTFAVRVGFLVGGGISARDPNDARSYALLANPGTAPLGWVRFDRQTMRPDSFYCCPMYVSTHGIPCLALKKDAKTGRLERIGLAMVCDWERISENGDIEELDQASVLPWLNSTARATLELI